MMMILLLLSSSHWAKNCNLETGCKSTIFSTGISSALLFLFVSTVIFCAHFIALDLVRGHIMSKVISLVSMAADRGSVKTCLCTHRKSIMINRSLLSNCKLFREYSLVLRSISMQYQSCELTIPVLASEPVVTETAL